MLFYFLSILSKIKAGMIDEKKIPSAKSKITDLSFLYNINKNDGENSHIFHRRFYLHIFLVFQ